METIMAQIKREIGSSAWFYHGVGDRARGTVLAGVPYRTDRTRAVFTIDDGVATFDSWMPFEEAREYARLHRLTGEVSKVI